MIRIAVVLALLCIVAVSLAGTDWQPQTSQTANDDFVILDGTFSVADSANVYRAFIDGADSSDAANSFDFVWGGASCSCFVAPDTLRNGWTRRSSRWNVYKVSPGADTLYRQYLWITGRLAARGSVDDTATAANSVSSGDVIDYTLQTADYDTASVTGLAIADDAVGPDELSDGGTYTVFGLVADTIRADTIRVDYLDATNQTAGSIVLGDTSVATNMVKLNAITVPRLAFMAAATMTDSFLVAFDGDSLYTVDPGTLGGTPDSGTVADGSLSIKDIKITGTRTDGYTIKTGNSGATAYWAADNNSGTGGGDSSWVAIEANTITSSTNTVTVDDTLAVIRLTTNSGADLSGGFTTDGTAEINATLQANDAVNLGDAAADSIIAQNLRVIGAELVQGALTANGTLTAKGTVALTGPVTVGTAATAGVFKISDGSSNTSEIRALATATNDTLYLPLRDAAVDTLSTMRYSRSVGGGGGGTGDLTAVASGALIDLADSLGPVPRVTFDVTGGDARYINEGALLSGSDSLATRAYARSVDTNSGGDITGVGKLPAGYLTVNADSLSGKPLLSLNTTQTDARYVNEAQANAIDSSMVADGSLSDADMKWRTATFPWSRIAALAAGDSLKLGTGSVTSTALATGQVKSADIQDLGVATADIAADAVDSTKVGAGKLARSDLSIGGTATAGYVPKSTGDGWAWAADTGGTVDSSTVTNGTLSTDDLKIGGTQQTGYVLKATGTDGAAWQADATGAVSLPMDSLRVTGPTLLNGDARLGDSSSDSLRVLAGLRVYSGTATLGTAGVAGSLVLSDGSSNTFTFTSPARSSNATMPLFDASASAGNYSIAVSYGTTYTTWSTTPRCTGGMQMDGSPTFGDARADSIYMKGTIPAADASRIMLKNRGGTGTTSFNPPGVTGDHAFWAPIGGQVAKGTTTHRAAVYIAGLSTAARCVATYDPGDVTGTFTAIDCGCTCKTDSLIVYAPTASAININYLWWGY